MGYATIQMIQSHCEFYQFASWFRAAIELSDSICWIHKLQAKAILGKSLPLKPIPKRHKMHQPKR